MEYVEWLEHAKTFLDNAGKQTFKTTAGVSASAVIRFRQIRPVVLAVVEAEIAAERKREELAVILTPVTTENPFRCARCGVAICYGERQHVCEEEE